MAIAFDAATNPALANSTSLTYSHTCTGSDRILYVSVMMRNMTITGVTYNGVSMTEIGSRVLIGNNDYLAHYYLIAPATGANNVVVSGSASNIIISGATSYTGCAQSSQPDANNNRAVTTTSTLTTSLTTVADNSWAVLSARGNSTGNTTAGTGTTQRANTNGYMQMYDGNGAVTPAGSTSLNTTQTSQPIVHLMASFAPAAAAAATSIKSIAGVAQADIKSVESVALADIKSIAGVSNIA